MALSPLWEEAQIAYHCKRPLCAESFLRRGEELS